MNCCQTQYNPLPQKPRCFGACWDIPRHYAVTGLVIFLFSLALYIFTLAPTVIWGDSADFALKVKEFRLGSCAMCHPLFIVLGKLFSFLPFELAYSLNLLTAISASVAVLFVYLIIFEITGSKISALVGSLALCVSHAFWLHAVIAEVYDLNAAFVAVVIFLLLKWQKDKNNYLPLYIAAFVFGLGLSNHRIIIFELVGIVFFVIATEPKILGKLKVMASVLLSFLAGSSLLIYTILKELPKKSIPMIADTLTAGGYKEAFIKYIPKIFNEIGFYFSYLFYQFPIVGFLLGILGITGLFRKNKKLALFFILLIGINALFFLKFGPSYGYTKYTFYISDYMVFSILVGYGFYLFHDFVKEKHYPVKRYSCLILTAVFLLPIILYNIAPYVSKKLNTDLLHARTIPYRDNEMFFLNPSKRGYTGAERYAKDAMTTAKPESIILADHTPLSVLRYFQEIKGIRTDIALIKPGSRIKTADGSVKFNKIKDIVAENYGKRDIYLADIENERYYRLNALKSDYDFIPDGVLFRIVRKEK